MTKITDLAKLALEFLKLAPRYLISVVLITGTLVFSPDSWLKHLGLHSFTETYRQWLGLAFLISITLSGVAAVAACSGWISTKLFKRRIRRHVIRRLNSLTEDEKQILRYYIAMNTRANMLKVNDGVVLGLVADGIIYRSASMGSIIEGFAHNITDFAWDYINANPQVLQGTTNFYRTDKQDRMW